jgi:hypothetical protein
VPIYTSYILAGWFEVGGTSFASPSWAALLAIANQGRALATKAPLTAAQATLYSLPSGDFHDITTGNNGYAAGPGYDLVTGIGSPIANTLVNDLVNTVPASAVTAVPTAPRGVTTTSNTLRLLEAEAVELNALAAAMQQAPQAVISSVATGQASAIVAMPLPIAPTDATAQASGIKSGFSGHSWLPGFAFEPATEPGARGGEAANAPDVGQGEFTLPLGNPEVKGPQAPSQGQVPMSGQSSPQPSVADASLATGIGTLFAKGESSSSVGCEVNSAAIDPVRVAGIGLVLGGYWHIQDSESEAREKRRTR